MPGKADEGDDDGKGADERGKKREGIPFSGGLLLPENDSGILRPPPPPPLPRI